MSEFEYFCKAIAMDELDFVGRAIPHNDLNARNHEGDTPLIVAVRAVLARQSMNRPQATPFAMVDLLLPVSDVNQTTTGNNDGQTVLMIAAAGPHATLVERLLAAGADPSQQDGMGRWALIHAMVQGKPSPERDHVLRALIPVTAQDMVDINSYTPLMHAASMDDDDAIKTLLPVSNVRSTTERGGNALMIACFFGAEKAVDALLDVMSPDDMSLIDGNGATAHAIAQAQGYHGIMQKLLMLEHRALIEVAHESRQDVGRADLTLPRPRL